MYIYKALSKLSQFFLTFNFGELTCPIFTKSMRFPANISSEQFGGLERGRKFSYCSANYKETAYPITRSYQVTSNDFNNY